LPADATPMPSLAIYLSSPRRALFAAIAITPCRCYDCRQLPRMLRHAACRRHVITPHFTHTLRCLPFDDAMR